MRFLHRLFFVSLIFLGFLFFAQSTHASEGSVELRSTTGENYKCYVSSVQMMDLNYTVLVTCRNLLYPAGEDIFNYVLWASPKSGKSPVKLGALGLGRATFKTKISFSSLFVTTEPNKKVKDPSGPVVMRGTLEPIEFLTEEESSEKVQEKEEKTESETEAEITPTPKPSTTNRIVTGLKRAGIILVLLLFTVVGLIFVVTRKK